MPATKISELLPFPEGVKKPHAYQVFGIEDGEQDLAVISGKIREVVGKLKSVKETTDPKLWSKAAKLAQQARLTLANPEAKAKLDARFGIILDEPPVSLGIDPLAGVLPASDPLAGILPDADPLSGTDPLAGILPVADPVSASPSNADMTAAQAKLPLIPQVAEPKAMPAGVFGTPTDPTPSPVMEEAGRAIPIVVPANGPGTFKVSQANNRRPKPILGLLMFATFAVGMLALIGGLGYFLFGGGELSITQTDDGLTVSTNPRDNNPTDETQSKGTKGRAVPQPLDPVMGTLGPSTKKMGNSKNNSGLGKQIANSEKEKDPGPKPDPMMEKPEPDPPITPPKPPAVPKDPPVTAEMIAEADKQLAAVGVLIKSAQWDKMKPAAEKVSDLPMNDEQKAQAEALYELADLATFYRGGIEKAVKDISVGNDFEVTKDLRVIVVEKGDDFIAIQFNARKKTYKFDEMPFSLAHKLASFTIPDSPTGLAAKSVYQAISPESNEETRKESLEWLNGMGGGVEGADPKRIVDSLQTMFAEGA
jgi:hypothetical protein